MFEKFFKKKPNEKAIRKFWKDFEARSDLYLNILENEAEDGDDYLWMMSLIRTSLKPCVLDTTVGCDFRFDRNRDPMRFVFLHMNDEYLRAVGEKMKEFYPQSLAGKIEFAVEE